jgi:hypothetical protein
MKKTFILILLSFLSFHLSSSAQVDSTIGTDISGSANYAVLAHQLTDGVQSERLKVNAIYNWITHNIRYDVKALKKTSLKPDEVATVLKKRKAVCDGYSKLFTALCEEAGIKAVTIEGYAKDWMFDNGDQFYIPRHAWNAVYVEGRWHLVEPTWGAGHLVQEPTWLKKLFGSKKNPTNAGGKLKFKFRYDPKWMLMDPLTFRKDHLPTDPLWQLTDSLMPISIFEAGDSAIMKFNRENNILVQNLPDLDRINKLDEFKRAQETAERITAYNPRYRVEMAAKYNADAIDSLEKTLKDKNNPTEALNRAKDELKKAEKEIAAQKSTISTEYSVLKKKNKTKSLEAKEQIRLLRSDNKRLIANCKSKINTANSKLKSIGDKEDTNIEKSANLAKGKKGKQTSASKKEVDATSPELLSIEDNVALINGKIDDLQEEINTRTNLITEIKRDNDRRLDSLVLCFRLCDSALVMETIARLNMHDDMDDEVIKWHSIVKQNRLKDLDSLQKYFIAGYDTVLNNYDALRKSHFAQLEEYRKAFKELDKYKRRNNSNTAFLSQHNTLVDNYNKSNEAYMQLLSDNKVYIMEHKSLFNNIVDLYKRQEKLAEYMEKSEETRKKLEEKNLAHKEEFDKKENEKQREQIKQTTKRIEKVLASK